MLLKKYEKEIRVKIGIACFGDSLIEGFPFGKQSSWITELETTEEIEALNYGLCGDCADDIFDRLRYQYIPEHVHHILFLGGANDAIQGVPEKFTMEIFRKLVNWCNDNGYKLCIVLPLISSDDYLNRRLLNIKQELVMHYSDKEYLLDLQPAIGLDAGARAKAYLDGVHPLLETYKRMGQYARPLLVDWINRDK